MYEFGTTKAMEDRIEFYRTGINKKKHRETCKKNRARRKKRKKRKK